MDPMNPVEVTPEMLEANPWLAVTLAAFSLYVMLALAGALLSWGYVGWTWWNGRRILPVWPWRPRPWGLADLVFTAIAVVVVQVLVGSAAVRLFSIDPTPLQSGMVPMPLAAAVSGGYLLTVLLVTAWIVLRYQTTPAVLGWSTKQLGSKLLIGVMAGLVAIPIVLAISAAVSIGFQTEYEHPILESMKTEGTFSTFLLALFCATIAAPIAEEFLFRVLIQGWLQSIPFSNIQQILLGRLDSFSQPAISIAGDTGIGSETDNPYSPATVSGTQEQPPESSSPLSQNGEADAPSPSARESKSSAPFWPSLVSGTLFGLAHWEYGLSFVPLIVLGVILGLLYRATLSIWPCIMVHFMLNATSMFAMGVGVYLEKVAGG
jgi:membrane protease YdiL (CAAX protease family)